MPGTSEKLVPMLKLVLLLVLPLVVIVYVLDRSHIASLQVAYLYGHFVVPWSDLYAVRAYGAATEEGVDRRRLFGYPDHHRCRKRVDGL